MNWKIPAGLLAAALAYPFVFSGNFAINFGILVLFFALIGQAWNIAGGFGGQLSFGHAVFFGTGAYAMGVLQVKFGWNAWAAAPVAAACGAGSMVTAFVGSVSTCLTGPVNAILSSAGERHRHYTGGIVVGVLALGFGLMSPFFTRLLLATPPAFIAALGGLAMLRVLQTAFSVSFGGGKFTLGALVTFLVTVADVPIFNIGAAFWGLVFGFGISWLLERGDFSR